MGFSRPQYWSGWPFPSPGDLPNPGIEPRSPTLQADSLPAELPGNPVQSLSRVRLFATSWTAARQASLSFTISRSLLRLMSIESVMPSNHLILCCPLLSWNYQANQSLKLISSVLGLFFFNGASRKLTIKHVAGVMLLLGLAGRNGGSCFTMITAPGITLFLILGCLPG